MIKIDLMTFDLVCERKEDERKFLYKYLTKTWVKLVDCHTGSIQEMSEGKFRRFFKKCENINRGNRKRPYFMNFGRKRIA